MPATQGPPVDTQASNTANRSTEPISMRRAYKYRLYPTRLQADALTRLLNAHRDLYNAALEQRRLAWRRRRVSLTYYDQANELKATREVDADLARVNYSSLQATLRRLDRSFRSFFRRVRVGEAPGYPRFKGRDRFDTVEFPAYRDGCKLTGRRLYLQSVGHIKVKVHRSHGGRVKTVSVKREIDKWYAVVSCQLEAPAVAPSTNPPVGIDLGLSAFLTTSDDRQISPPRFYRCAQAQLRRTQRALARRESGSHRRWKCRVRAAKVHRHIRNQRRDWHHKLTHNLVQRYGVIVHEDLNIRGIARTRLAKSTLDAGWGQFLAILRYKAADAGVAVVAVDPHNTTQACSACGALPEIPLTLRERVFHCLDCGFHADRDVNAARNILRLGSSRQAPTPTIAEVA